MPRLGSVAPEEQVSILCCQCIQINALLIVAELERPEHVHVLPSHRRHALDERDGVQIPRGHLLFIHLGQQRRVVVDNCIGDQPQLWPSRGRGRSIAVGRRNAGRIKDILLMP